MRKSVIAILILVAMLFSIHYAAAEDLDLTQMSTRELQKLRQRINVELKSRPEEVEPVDETERRKQIRSKYNAWNESFDYDSMLSDIESGEHGLGEECAVDIKALASRGKELLDLCNVDYDPFTDEMKITSKQLTAFADGCQVFPFVDQYGFYMLLGFPYDDSLHYDHIYLKIGDIVSDYERFDKNYGFDIQFETLNNQRWEYSQLSYIYLGLDPLVAVSFRGDGSVRKVNYTLTEEETQAAHDLFELSEIKSDIWSRMSHFESLGD